MDPIVIKMMADAAGLKRDMDKAQGIIGGATDKMRSAFNSVKGALAGLGLGLSVAGLSAWVKSAIDAADEASKMAQKIGVATKHVAGLQLAFQQSGLSAQDMQMGMVRLAKSIGDNNKAFGAMGVATRNADGSMRDSVVVLRDVADRFAALEDGTTKTALAYEIFGRRGADMIPLLNGGAAALDEMDAMARKLGLTIDTETGKSAEQFNDTLELVRLSGQGVGTQIAAQLLPTLNALAGSMLDSVTEGDRLRRMADILAGALKGLYSVAVGVVEVFNTLGKVMGAQLAGWMALARGEVGQAWQILKEAAADIKQGWVASGEAISKAWSDAGSTTVDAGVKVVRANRETAAAAATMTKALDGQASARARLTAEDRAALQAQKELEQRVRQLAEGLARARMEDLDATLQQSAAIAEQTAKLHDEAQRIGLTETELRALERARLDEAVATAEQRLQTALAAGVRGEELDGITMMVEELRKLRDAKEAGWAKEAAVQARDAAKEAGDAWAATVAEVQGGLTDALMRAFESGKGFMDAFRDTLVNSFRTLVLQPTIRAIMAPVTGAVGSLLGGTAAASTGGAAGGALGGLGSLGGLMSGVGAFGSYAATGLMSTLTGSVGASFGAAGSLLGGGNIAAGLGMGLGSALPFIGAAMLVGSGLTRTLKDYGIEGELSSGGIDGNQYKFLKGGWLKSDKTKRSPLDSGMESSLDAAVTALYDSTAAAADALGLNSDAITGYTESIKLSTRKLSEDEIAAELEKMLAALGENLAQQVGMTAEELSTLAASLTGVNDVLGHFDQQLLDVSVAGGEAAVQLAGLMGGIDNLAGALGTYTEQFVFGGDNLAYTLDQVGKVLGDLGQTVPATRDEFMALVESQDLMTESGRSTYAALMQVAGAMDSVYDASEAAAAAATEAARAMSALGPPGGLTLAGNAVERLNAAEAIRSGAAGAEWLAAYQADNANMNRPGSQVGDRIDLWASAYLVRQAEDAALREIAKANSQKQWEDMMGGRRTGESSPGAQRQQEKDRLLQEQIKGTEGLIDALDSMRRGMLDLKNELVGGVLDPANPALKYASEREFVLGLGRQAAAGDMAAAEMFQDQLGGFLRLSQGYNASGEAYARDFDAMIGLLDKINATLERQQSTATATLKVQQSGLSQVADATERTARATDRQARTASVLEQRGIE